MSKLLAMPKSVILVCPSCCSRMLLGLMSRCSTPRAWAAASASSVSAITRSTRCGDKGPAGDDLVAQRGPGQALHHEIGRRVIFAEVQHGDDVGMEQPCRDQRLLLEPLPHARERARLGPQDLHRRLALETLVEGIEDSGHAALAQERRRSGTALRSGAPCASPPGLCTPSAGSVVVPPDPASASGGRAEHQAWSAGQSGHFAHEGQRVGR